MDPSESRTDEPRVFDHVKGDEVNYVCHLGDACRGCNYRTAGEQSVLIVGVLNPRK